MSDAADVIREFVQSPYGWAKWERVEKQNAALAALDALDAGSDDWQDMATVWKRRAEAAEAELAIEREANPSRVFCPKCQANLPCESCKRYSVQRDELEAEISRLRELLEQIMEFTHRSVCVEAWDIAAVALGRAVLAAPTKEGT